MPEIKIGIPAPDFELPDLGNTPFRLSSLHGRAFYLTFLRFASCPFCNLRVHNLVRGMENGDFGDDFSIVAVFDSPLENLQRFAARHDAPFPVLADEGGIVHDAWGRQTSWAGVFKGMFGRMGTLMQGMLGKGYLPLSLKGRFTGMPMDFLIDPEGLIRQAYYGRDEGDHLPLSELVSFAAACAG